MYKIKYDQPTVAAAIKRLADTISANENTVFLVLMNGGAWFAHELLCHFTSTPVRVEYAKLSSYDGKQRGELNISYLPDIDWNGKEVVVLDDICDSGNTLCSVYRWLQKKNVASIRFLTLLARQGRYHLEDGMDLTVGISDNSDDFFVGCGLDDNGFCRNLPYVGIVS